MRLLSVFILFFGLNSLVWGIPKDFETLPETAKPFVQNENDDTIVALVNDRKIFFKDMQFRFFNMLRAHFSVYPDAPLSNDIVLGYRKIAIEHQITKLVLAIEIERLKLTPTESQLAEAIQHLRNNFSSQEEFDKRLKEQNADLALLKEETSFQMAVDALVKSFDQKVADITDSELQAFYTEHLSDFKIPRKIRFSLIMLLHDPDSKPEVMAKNLKLIRQIRQDILARKNTFEYYAKNFSDDESTRQSGGDAGTVVEKDIKDIFTPIKDLWVGELSQVYSFAKGFYLAKVTEETAESVIPFPEVKDKLKSQMHNQALQKNREKCINDIRAQLKINLL